MCMSLLSTGQDAAWRSKGKGSSLLRNKHTRDHKVTAILKAINGTFITSRETQGN